MRRPTGTVRTTATIVAVVYGLLLYVTGIRIDSHIKHIVSYVPALLTLLLAAWDLWVWRWKIVHRFSQIGEFAAAGQLLHHQQGERIHQWTTGLVADVVLDALVAVGRRRDPESTRPTRGETLVDKSRDKGPTIWPLDKDAFVAHCSREPGLQR